MPPFPAARLFFGMGRSGSAEEFNHDFREAATTCLRAAGGFRPCRAPAGQLGLFRDKLLRRCFSLEYLFGRQSRFLALRQLSGRHFATGLRVCFIL